MANYKIYYIDKYLTTVKGVDCIDDAIEVFKREDNLFAKKIPKKDNKIEKEKFI